MAQRALPPGAIRRRTAFGLLDADGWTWAGLKATFWFLLIIFMLGYLPNLAYFFTTAPTVEVGYNFASIVNFCPADNERDLPCPAPAGSTLPWQPSPAELALPAARLGSSVFQSSTTAYLIGGETENGATDEVLITTVSSEGNLSPWTVGPSLPEARSRAAVGLYAGTPFVIGGIDASGAATDTVYKGIVDQGVLTGWELADGSNGTDELTLPQPLSDAGVVTGTSGFVMIGGRDAEGDPVNNVHVAWLDEVSPGGRLLAWQPLEGLALPEARADAVVAKIADFIYVVGGDGPDGATSSVYRAELKDRDAAVDEAGRTLGWAVAPEDQMLPAARTDAVAFSSNGAVYVMGGLDESGTAQQTVWWAIPDTLTGDFADGWQHEAASDLATPIASAAISGVGSTAFIFGGLDEDGPTDSSMRAGLSPRPPFFQLGIAGATLPGMAIQGQVGQELGYLAVMTVGMGNFVLLVLVALAYSHQATSKRIIARLSGGRLKVPPEEEYGP
ncbi:MAG: hypothetical protein ACC726_05485 [Chloroflexota bacterium]